MTDTELAARIREITGQEDNFLVFVRSQYDRMAMTDVEGAWSVTAVFDVDNIEKTYAIDASTLTGAYYIGFGACEKCEIYRFWIE